MIQKWKLCFSSYSTCSRMPCIESTGAVGANEWNGSKICKTRCGRWSAPQLNVQPGVIVHRPLIMRGCIKNSQKLDEHRFGASQVPHSLIWPIHPRHLFSNKMARAYKFEIKKSRHTTSCILQPTQNIPYMFIPLQNNYAHAPYPANWKLIMLLIIKLKQGAVLLIYCYWIYLQRIGPRRKVLCNQRTDPGCIWHKWMSPGHDQHYRHHRHHRPHIHCWYKC